MKTKWILTLLLAGIFTVAAGQDRPAPAFFPRPDLMKIGVYYYPEQWPEAQWQRDLDNMAKLGFEFTHFAEFSWTFLEPQEGKFDFAWLDKAIALASQAGLKVILCTPSAAPPSWMGNKYPDIYRIDEHARRHEHGIRAEVSLTNPRYLACLDRIVEAMARRYGRDPRIWGWQVDNEPAALPDFSPATRTAFQTWLRARYGTIDKLNDSWGGAFWSSRYASFAEVLLPNAALAEEDKLSPHALVDLRRFMADTQAAFLDRQANLIRKYARSDQWVTTNYTNVSVNADPRRTTRLDFLTFTIYPVAGANVLGGESFAIGNPFRLMEACDYHRPLKGVFGVMELQPGQVNWASTNPQPQPGAVHMWIWHAFGGGASFLCTYRYRHPLRGSEMYHDGIVGTDGVTLSRGGREFVQAIKEIKDLRGRFDSKAVLPGRLAARRTALLWSHDVLWDLEAQPQSAAWKTWGHRNTYTTAVKYTGAPLDFISEWDDFSTYPFLVAPAYQLVDPALARKWQDYAERGGHLILSCRTAQKDAGGHFPEGPWAAPITELIGADLEFFDMLPPDVTAAVKAGDLTMLPPDKAVTVKTGDLTVLPSDKAAAVKAGNLTGLPSDMAAAVKTSDLTYPWNAWADVLTPRPGTEVLATYADRFYAGKAAAVTRRVGKGSVTYIGVATTDGELERWLVREVYRRAGVAIDDLPKGVYVEWRDGFFVGVNYSNQAIRLPIPPLGRILIGENPLPPAQAVVWTEEGKPIAR